MQRSAAAAQVPELPRELVVAIARAAKHGVVLTTMLRVCRTWRAALNAELVSLWRETALARFPRLHGILAGAELPHTGAQAPCFRTLYRNQLDADATEATAEIMDDNYPGLDQYVLTVEIDLHRRKSQLACVVARSSVRLDKVPSIEERHQGVPFNVSLHLQKMIDYDHLLPAGLHQADHEIILDTAADVVARYGYISIYVTRLTDMKTTRLMDTGDAEISDENEYLVHFLRAVMPRTPMLFGNTGLNAESQPEITAIFDTADAAVEILFYETPMRDSDGRILMDSASEALMTVHEVKRYLARFAVWGRA